MQFSVLTFSGLYTIKSSGGGGSVELSETKETKCASLYDHCWLHHLAYRPRTPELNVRNRQKPIVLPKLQL